MRSFLDWLWDLLASWCVPPWALHLGVPPDRPRW